MNQEKYIGMDVHQVRKEVRHDLIFPRRPQV
jgi:hypothetical protein